MRAIRSSDTSPELVVRRLVHSLGRRYRLHGQRLPGKPDLVFAGQRKIIFVHGCFWHQHPCSSCQDSRRPKSNTAYWLPKLERNVSRDAENLFRLKADGWRVLVVWECETKDRVRLSARLRRFLNKEGESRATLAPVPSARPRS